MLVNTGSPWVLTTSHFSLHSNSVWGCSIFFWSSSLVVLILFYSILLWPILYLSCSFVCLRCLFFLYFLYSLTFLFIYHVLFLILHCYSAFYSLNFYLLYMLFMCMFIVDLFTWTRKHFSSSVKTSSVFLYEPMHVYKPENKCLS